MIQESPKGFLTWEQLLSGRHGWRPGCVFIAYGRQLKRQPQRLFRFTTNRSAVFAQLVSADLGGFPEVPALKKRVLQTWLQRAHRGAGSVALCNDGKITEDERPSVLPLLKRMLAIKTKSNPHKVETVFSEEERLALPVSHLIQAPTDWPGSETEEVSRQTNGGTRWGIESGKAYASNSVSRPLV